MPDLGNLIYPGYHLDVNRAVARVIERYKVS